AEPRSRERKDGAVSRIVIIGGGPSAQLQGCCCITAAGGSNIPESVRILRAGSVMIALDPCCSGVLGAGGHYILDRARACEHASTGVRDDAEAMPGSAGTIRHAGRA
ncbi:hypothetical protein, partial [Micromonospora sp. NPDC005172]|uniref:hypothetical protein n=1 Tax=Micromonospora sp. NPDC005172 TaxID=3156867 RepID=UPI0033A40561